MKKIAILNDIHGNLYLLNKVLDRLKKENIDYYLFLGDYLTDGPDGNEIINTIKKLPGEQIIGNREESVIKYQLNPFEITDKQYPLFYTYTTLTKENLKYITNLPYYKILTIENKKICISHGSPYHVREKVKKNNQELFKKMIKDFDADIYFFAHTHDNFEVSYENHLFINSGAINLPREKSLKSTYGILSIDNENIKYEQKELSFEYEELQEYYVNSDFFKHCYIWGNLILHTIKDGISYYMEFSKSYDDNKSYIENFQDYMIKRNLKIINKN